MNKTPAVVLPKYLDEQQANEIEQLNIINLLR
jgi:hypothetical protein